MPLDTLHIAFAKSQVDVSLRAIGSPSIMGFDRSSSQRPIDCAIDAEPQSVYNLRIPAARVPIRTIFG